MAHAGGEIPAKFLSPLAYRFVGYVDATHGERILDHAQAQGKAEIEPNDVGDHLGREAAAVINVRRGCRHAQAITTKSLSLSLT
jgi:hypothetical protein